MNKNYNIIFIGTSDFGIPALDKLLLTTHYKLLTIITSPDKPAGRKQTLTPSPMKEWAVKRNVPVLQPQKIRTIKDEIKKLNPDLIITAAYGQILPKDILDIPKLGSMNLHASLLPKYRGASPIHAAILNGDKETGITIMMMDARMDEGDIIADCRLQIADLNYKELHEKLAQASAELLMKTLPDYLEGAIKPIPQDGSKATYTKIIKKEDGKIDWNNQTAEEIERMVKAYHIWPGTFTFLDGKRLKVIKARLLHPAIGCADKNQPGQTFLTEQNEVAVNCSPGSIILKKMQIAGGKEMDAGEFIKGRPRFIGNILG